MTKDEAIHYFGTQAKLAAALGITQGSVAGWGDRPPIPRQYQIQVLTDGALIADPITAPDTFDDQLHRAAA